jgi:hypothetical protein
MANQDDFVRLTLRLPLDLADKLTVARIAGVRSLNAEIVGRLIESFEGAAGRSEEPDFRVVLESAQPISWDEINSHVSAIAKAMPFRPNALTVAVVTPEVISSADRQDEAEALEAAYRRLAKARQRRKEAMAEDWGNPSEAPDEE